MSSDPQKWKRWLVLQFSTRLLLAVVTACCVLLAGYYWLCVFARHNELSVRCAEQLGCSVVYDYEFNRDGKFVDSARRGRRRWVVPVFGGDPFGRVVVLDLPSEADRRHVEVISRFPHLFRLICDGAPVRDDDVIDLCQRLRLTDVYLAGTDVTDRGVDHFALQSDLRVLSIRDTRVTSAGIMGLKACRGLEILDLSGTSVSEDAAMALRKELPACLVEL